MTPMLHAATASFDAHILLPIMNVSCASGGAAA
jgi:hypothetical protein